jgi:hypothetical protein
METLRRWGPEDEPDEPEVRVLTGPEDDGEEEPTIRVAGPEDEPEGIEDLAPTLDARLAAEPDEIVA